MNRSRYSIGADSPRWWWPFVAVGAAAGVAIVAIPASTLGAVPVDGSPVGAADRGVSVTTTNATASSKPCFFGLAAGAAATEPTRAVCRTTPTGARVRESAAACPSAPDVRYVGVPWVPGTPTGCTDVDRWWTQVRD